MLYNAQKNPIKSCLWIYVIKICPSDLGRSWLDKLIGFEEQFAKNYMHSCTGCSKSASLEQQVNLLYFSVMMQQLVDFERRRMEHISLTWLFRRKADKK